MAHSACGWNVWVCKTVRSLDNACYTWAPYVSFIGTIQWLIIQCTVADVVPSWSEDCTFSVVVRSSLGDRNCTIYCKYCLPAATGYQPFCLFLFC